MKRKIYSLILLIIVSTLFLACENGSSISTSSPVASLTLGERAGTYEGIVIATIPTGKTEADVIVMLDTTGKMKAKILVDGIEVDIEKDLSAKKDSNATQFKFNKWVKGFFLKITLNFTSDTELTLTFSKRFLAKGSGNLQKNKYT